MSARERLIGPEPEPGEERILASLRPTTLDETEYIGQGEVVRPLKIALQAAKQRGGASWTTCLFYGPPGLGKTTLAQIIRHEMGTNGLHLGAGAEEGRGPARAALQPEGRGRLLHRRDPPPAAEIEEYLYPAMEDFVVDFVLDKGANARAC